MTTPVHPSSSGAVHTHRRYRAEELVDFTSRVLQACGMAEGEARIGAEVLIDADLMGIDSHGIAHLATHGGYVLGFRAGHVNPRPVLRVLRETASTALLDADGAFGPLAGYRGMQLAIRKAKEAGSGSVAVTNSRHFGAAGYYALMAVPEGCIGLALTNAGPWVAPAGGRKKMIGTNPIAVAAPAGTEQPFLMDIATSTVAMGKLEIARREGKPIPPGWSLDAGGLPTTDIELVYREGGLTPLGSTLGTSSYKGYALGQMVDVFAGILSGAGYSMSLARGVPGHFFGAWQVEAFLPLADFAAMMDEMQRAFRAAEPAEDCERVLLPGQREFDTRRDREANGIPLHPSVYGTLDTLAEEMGIPGPRALE
jgi:L-2-hydroxycarboxylate dehydrogenase (NAD+)